MYRLLFLLLIPIFTYGGEVKICLTMMVKNDEAVIEPCLNSIKEIVDCVSICDIGSTDKTLKIIRQFLTRNGIPGEIHKQQWQDYGKNRTLSVEAAQRVIKKLGFEEEKSYYLILDPDSILKTGGSFNKDVLDQDGYMVLEKSSVLDFYSYDLRLLRASLKWESIGIIHEYWSCREAREKPKLRTIMVEERSDEKSRKEKLTRNVDLLTKALTQDPENKRYMFYLAQSYRCLKEYEE